MPNKDENKQNSLKYSIWNTNTDEVHMEHDLASRSESLKSSLNKLEQASQVDDKT
jgi:hypothetical protein